MHFFGFIFYLLALISPSLALPLATYRPGEITNSTTTPGTTIMHGRCGVHIHQEMTGGWDPVNVRAGKINAYILDNNHTEIGKMGTRWFNIYFYPDVEFHSRLDDIMWISPGEPVLFWLGDDSWNSSKADGRCSVGGWRRRWFWHRDWARPEREMDCGFAC